MDTEVNRETGCYPDLPSSHQITVGLVRSDNGS
jgi:hypothetical protein